MRLVIFNLVLWDHLFKYIYFFLTISFLPSNKRYLVKADALGWIIQLADLGGSLGELPMLMTQHNSVTVTFGLILVRSTSKAILVLLQDTDITVHKPRLSHAYACAYDRVANKPALVTICK